MKETQETKELNRISKHLTPAYDRPTARSMLLGTGLVGFVSNTIGISGSISMATFGMRYSLLSRDLIADSIETIASAHHYDSLLIIMGCDPHFAKYV